MKGGRAEMCKEVEEYVKEKLSYMIMNVLKKKNQNMTNEEILTYIMEAYDLSEEEAKAYIKSAQL